MPLTIVPPELIAADSNTSGAKKEFQTLELLPNKLESGTSTEVRLLGTYSSGHMLAPFRAAVEEKQPDGTLKFAGYDYAEKYDGFDRLARVTDWTTPDRRKIDDQHVKPKRALCALVYSYERDQVEVMIMEQRSLKDSLVEILGDADDFSFSDDGIAEFVLKISKSGSGLETTYSMLPKPRKVEAKVKEAFEAVKETATMDKLLKGQHPLRQPKASFSSEESSEF